MLNDETLEERLHRDLDRVRPGAVPLDALVGHGRVIKARRRAGLAAGLAAVAALAVGVPTVLGGGGGLAGVSSGGHRTVLASGTIDGKEWSFVTEDPFPAHCPGYVSARWGTTNADSCLGEFPAATDPVSLTSGGGFGEVDFYIAQLRADVDHVTLTGTDGAVWTPTVARVSGRRYALFAVPPKQGIARLDTYAADGKAIAYTVPYIGPADMPNLVETWYPAGTTPTQAAVKQTLLSDTMAPASTLVTATVDMGPFGVCFQVSVPQGLTGATGFGPDCSSVAPPAATVLSLRDYQLGARDLKLADVNNVVDHVVATLSDGTTSRLIPLRVGGRSFVVTFLAPGVKLVAATAYGASGDQLAKTP
jgi:hypothetical protein